MSADAPTNEELPDAACNGDQDALAERRDRLKGKRTSVEEFAQVAGAAGRTTD